MSDEVSIAIETSCRNGGAALGRGDELLGAAWFDAQGRAAGQLITTLDKLLTSRSLRPTDIRQVYVSVGPGSFTGVRVGVTAARTLAQAAPEARCVAVPTSLVVAERVARLDWTNLAVVLDAGDGRIYVTRYVRRDGEVVAASPPVVTAPGEWLASAPRPILLTGEGLSYHELSGEGVELADPAVRPPEVEILWRVGRRLANAGDFTEYHSLLPIYARPAGAVRSQRRAGDADRDAAK